MKFYCIADEDTVRGFRLAGVEGRSVSSTREASMALADAVKCLDLAVVVLTQPIGDGIREEIDALRLERDRPLLVEIPGPGGSDIGYRSLHRLARSAVGIRVDKGG